MPRRRVLNHVLTPPEEYESRRGGRLHQRRVDLVVAAMAARAPDARSACELGCGTGAVLADVARRVPSVGFVGIDVDGPLVDYAQAHHSALNADFVLADAADLDGRSFDFVFSIDFLHHLPDPAASVATIRKGIRPGGVWVIIEPNVWHPAMAWSQERMKRQGLGEEHFRPWVMGPALRRMFTMVEKRYLHLFPASADRWSERLSRLEQVAERAPMLGASVVYVLRAGTT